MNFASLKKHKNLSAWILSTSFCFSLCGCSTPSETFDCQPGQGVGCKSITEVNRMVDQQNLGKEADQGKQSMVLPLNAESFPSPTIPASPMRSEDFQGRTTPILISNAYTVQRMPEDYLRVWIAPFQDQQGNLHEGSVIHTVLKPGYWKMMNAQEVPDMKPQ